MQKKNFSRKCKKNANFFFRKKHFFSKKSRKNTRSAKSTQEQVQVYVGVGVGARRGRCRCTQEQVYVGVGVRRRRCKQVYVQVQAWVQVQVCSCGCRRRCRCGVGVVQVQVQVYSFPRVLRPCSLHHNYCIFYVFKKTFGHFPKIFIKNPPDEHTHLSPPRPTCVAQSPLGDMLLGFFSLVLKTYMPVTDVVTRGERSTRIKNETIKIKIESQLTL